jgi:hypothetical protein
MASCQTKRNQTDSESLTDTLQTSDIAQPNQNDTSIGVRPDTKDTIFLGFRIGMTRPDFEKHKQELIRNGKLKSAGNDLTYQIKVNENESLAIFASKEDDIPKKIWTGSGMVVPEFLDDKLISITLKFLNTKGNNVYSFFETNLNNKYYNSTANPQNYFKNNKKIDTLQVGNSVSWFITNKWSIGDISISLRFDRKAFKAAANKTKNTDDVILKYLSEYYYTLKQDKKADDESKERTKVQDDL